MHNCTIGRCGDAGKGRSQVILGHHQDGGGGVWVTYAPPGGIVGVHRSPWLQGEPRFTWRTEGVDKTPPHRFFQISQSPFPFHPTGCNGE